MRRASSEFILVSLCIQWLLPSEDSNTLVSTHSVDGLRCVHQLHLSGTVQCVRRL